MGKIEIELPGLKVPIKLKVENTEEVAKEICTSITDKVLEFSREYGSMPHYHHVLFHIDVKSEKALKKGSTIDLTTWDHNTSKKHHDAVIDNLVVTMYNAYGLSPDRLCRDKDKTLLEVYGLKDITYPTTLGIQISFKRALTIPEIFMQNLSIDNRTVRAIDNPALGKILLVDCKNYFPRLVDQGRLSYEGRSFGSVTLGIYKKGKDGSFELQKLLLGPPYH